MKTLLLAIALAACGGSQPPPSPPPVATGSPPIDAAVDAPRLNTASMLAKMNAFAADMCGCADRGCVERVTEQLTAWSQQMKTTHEQEVAMTDEDTRRMAEISERMASCVVKAMTGSAGSGVTP
jgi:hypothetical protein